ncbi:hypothetical protein M1M34_gp070 [Haloarcula tailed virus 2]|uniref:Uncharacterized protein n=1 Tax=Haloarcula tailed virus 2 TaxID=2877989 RepID=A0AAE8Y1P6_9CAUD|nr:hypothetical protein M1M34_gp070 [Haloarcula tailed virus 2]UBF23263.1 hypothetical protein HATV-2_gp112 [Haloarcula tailed virus 2]
MRLREKIGLGVAGGIVAVTNIFHDGYAKHWWWDNVGHFASGYVIGTLAPEGKETLTYGALVPFWEAFEWKLATMKLYEKYDWCPEGPRSMGYEGWDFDHQVEDTILDSLMGYYGVKLAQKVKQS